MPRPLSPGGRLATCTRFVFGRSATSVSAIGFPLYPLRLESKRRPSDRVQFGAQALR
jgi:hypothetical protein